MTGHSSRLAMPIHKIRDASLSASSSLLPPLLYSCFRLHSFSNSEPADAQGNNERGSIQTGQFHLHATINKLKTNTGINELQQTHKQTHTWPPEEDEFKVVLETPGVEHGVPK